ncbi:MAG: ferritin [Promethearchaeota archaeon]|nr:MAG: ferritin [Candidatus Lokiarchaeota archaeon]
MVDFISKELNDLMNKQIVEELRSGYIYLGMAAWAETQGLKGLANFMRIHAETEEYRHAMKFVDYILEAGGKVEYGTIEKVSTDWEDVEHVLKEAIKHEEHITSTIKNLMDLAQEKKEYYAYELLTWFIEEQMEEENLFTDLYDSFLLSGKNMLMWDRNIKHPD